MSDGAVTESPELVSTSYEKFGAAIVIEQLEMLFKVTVQVPLPRSVPFTS